MAKRMCHVVSVTRVAGLLILIHIKPEETQTIAQIPKELMFAAPGFPKGHVLLGYDKDGCCPMFIDKKCSIYEYRPQTCRQYDCRIFPATGLTVGDDKPLISQQEKRWCFNLSTRDESKLLSALQAAAKFLTTYSELLPAGFVLGNTTQQAILAIKIYDVFLRDEFMLENSADPKQCHDIAAAIKIAYAKFESGENNA